MKNLITAIAILLNLTGFAQEITGHQIKVNHFDFNNNGVVELIDAEVNNDSFRIRDLFITFQSIEMGVETYIQMDEETLHAHTSHKLADGCMVFHIDRSIFQGDEEYRTTIGTLTIDKSRIFGDRVIFEEGGARITYTLFED